MFSREQDALDKALASSIVSAVGTLDDTALEAVDTYTYAQEWAQVATAALICALENNRPMPAELLNEAISRWPNDMGEYLANLFRTRIRTFDDSTVAA